MIKISFNGEVREFAAEGKSYIELVSAVDPKLLSSYVAVKDGENVVDLRDVPADGACVELVGLEVSDTAGALSDLLIVLDDNNINVEYMYSYAGVDGRAKIAFKTSEPEKAVEVLKNAGAKII